MAREAWTDERLDDLNARMEKGFDGVKGEIRDVKGEVRELRQEMNGRFKEMNARFDSLETHFDSMGRAFDARFDSLQRTMVLGFVSMSATVVGALLVIQL